MKRPKILRTTLLFLILLAGGTWGLLRYSGIPASLIRDTLSRLLRGEFDLGSVSLDPLGGTVEIRNLEIGERNPVRKKGDRKVLTVPKVVVGVSMNPLSSPGRIRRVLVERPELDLWLGDSTPFDLSRILDLKNLEGDEGGRGEPFPVLEIRDMVVRLHLPGLENGVLVLSSIHLLATPSREEPQRILLEGSCPHPLGGTVTIKGTGDAEKREFRLIAETGGFRISEERAKPFGEAIQRLVRRLGLKGWVEPTLWVRYPDGRGGLAVGVRAKVAEFSVRPPTFRYLFTHLQGEVAWIPEGRVLQVRAERTGTDMSLKGSFRLEDLGTENETLRLSAEADGVLIDRRIHRALEGIPATRRLLRALNPEGGRARVAIHLVSGRPRNGDLPTLQLDLGLRDISLRFDGFPSGEEGGRRIAFPYPLREASGEVRIRDESIRFTDFHARGGNGGRIRGEGSILPGTGEVRLSFEADDLPFSPLLRSCLDRAVVRGAEIYDDYAPRGRTSLSLDLDLGGNGGEPKLDLRLRPRGASAAWKDFPYRIHNLTGEVRITTKEVSFRLNGNRGPETPIRARARFVFPGEGKDGSDEIHITASRLPLDDALRRGLVGFRGSFGERWKTFSPEGTADLDFLGWRKGGGVFQYDLRADLKDGRIFLEAFPTPVTSLRGTIALHGDGERSRVDLLGLEGRGLGADLLFEGVVREGPPGDPDDRSPAADLTIAAKGVRVDENLAEVLIAKGILDREVWKLCRATGRVDAVDRIRRAYGEEEFRHEILLDLREAESTAAFLPDRLHGLSGRVRIDEEQRIRLEDCKGYLGEALVRCHEGTIYRKGERTILDLLLSATEYPVDERLARLLEGEVKKAYLARKPRGRVSVADWRIHLEIPSTPPDGVEGLGLVARFGEGEFLAHNLAMEVGIPLTGIQGRARLRSGFFNPYGAEFRGSFNGLNLQALGQILRDTRGRFLTTHEDFVIEEGSMRLGRGRIRGPVPPAEGDRRSPLLRYGFGRKGRLDLNLALDDLRLAPLLKDFSRNQRYDGFLRGTIDLGVETEDLSTLRLDAKLGISKGKLGDVPIFRTIYSFLKPSKRQNFNAAALEVRGKDGVFRIEHLMLKSPIFKIEGRGTLGYDGYLKLHVDFPDLFPQAESYFILPGIYRFLANSLVSYEIWGYIGNTRTGPRFLFERNPKHLPMGPLPGSPVPRPPVFR